MRVGIPVNGRVTEPVDIPDPLPSWAADAAEWLVKQFPGKTGWVTVSSDAVPGATYNGPGSSTNPPGPPLVPMIFQDRKAIRKFLVAKLGAGAAGEIRLGAIIKGIKASTDERVNYAWDFFSGADAFEKEDVVGLFQLARSKDLPSSDTTPGNVARKVETAEITAIGDGWPVA